MIFGFLGSFWEFFALVPQLYLEFWSSLNSQGGRSRFETFWHYFLRRTRANAQTFMLLSLSPPRPYFFITFKKCLHHLETIKCCLFFRFDYYTVCCFLFTRSWSENWIKCHKLYEKNLINVIPVFTVQHFWNQNSRTNFRIDFFLKVNRWMEKKSILCCTVLTIGF